MYAPVSLPRSHDCGAVLIDQRRADRGPGQQRAPRSRPMHHFTPHPPLFNRDQRRYQSDHRQRDAVDSMIPNEFAEERILRRRFTCL